MNGFVSRNRPIPRPSTPCVLAVSFDFPPIPEQIRASRIVFDPRDGLFELPRPAVGREDFRVEQVRHATLSNKPIQY